MLFARNNLNQRIRATESGEKAECPCCNSIVIGRKNIVNSGYHWYHRTLVECDSWYQPMSEWHYDWQMIFPFDWQEVICNDKKTNKKHVADIKLPNGVIIEFQHSPLSHIKIIERENFYNKLIWVFDNSIFGIIDINLINKNVIEYMSYLKINPYGKIKTNKAKSFKSYLKNISKPLFIDLINQMIFIRKVYYDDGTLMLNNDEKYNFVKIYSDKDIYQKIILDIIVLSKDNFIEKYYYSLKDLKQ